MISDNIQKYKELLDKEAYDLALTLSPGVKLKAIMSKEVVDTQDPKIVTKQTQNASASRKKDRLLRVNRAYSVADDSDTVDKAQSSWMAIYDLLEIKRKIYKKEWEEEVMAHSLQSKQKLEKYAEFARNKLAPASKPKILKPRSVYIRENTKNTISKVIEASNPMEEDEEKIEHPEVVTVIKRTKPTPKREEALSTSMPEFRTLSIDKPVDQDLDILWSRANVSNEKRLARMKKVLLMSDTVLKVKVLTSQINKEGEGNNFIVYDEIEENQQAEFESLASDSSMPSHPKLEELSKKIFSQSRRAHSFIGHTQRKFAHSTVVVLDDDNDTNDNSEDLRSLTKESEPEIIIEHSVSPKQMLNQHDNIIKGPKKVTLKHSLNDKKINKPIISPQRSDDEKENNTSSSTGKAVSLTWDALLKEPGICMLSPKYTPIRVWRGLGDKKKGL